jgi:hypothetical protein
MGQHIFKWSYEKDGYVDSGEDCGWIDYVVFPPAASGINDDFVTNPIKLYGNYPNPFRNSTTIFFGFNADYSKIAEFFSNSNKEAIIEIYNVKGQKIRQLVLEDFTSKTNTVIWNGKDEFGKTVRSGVYFYKTKGKDDKFTSVKKMVLMK